MRLVRQERSGRIRLEAGQRIRLSRPERDHAAGIRVVRRCPVIALHVALDPKLRAVGLGRHDRPSVLPLRRERDPALRRDRGRECALAAAADRLEPGAVRVHPMDPCDKPARADGFGDRIAIRCSTPALRVEDETAIGRPRRRPIPTRIFGESPHVRPVRPHHVDVAGSVVVRRSWRPEEVVGGVAIAGKGDPIAVGGKRGIEVAPFISRDVPSVGRRVGFFRRERHDEDVGIAAPRTHERQRPPIWRKRGGIVHRVAGGKSHRRATTVQIQREQVRGAVAVRCEDDPPPIRRERRVVVGRGIGRQLMGRSAGFVEQVQVPVCWPDRAGDDGFLQSSGQLRAGRATRREEGGRQQEYSGYHDPVRQWVLPHCQSSGWPRCYLNQSLYQIAE